MRQGIWNSGLSMESNVAMGSPTADLDTEKVLVEFGSTFLATGERESSVDSWRYFPAASVLSGLARMRNRSACNGATPPWGSVHGWYSMEVDDESVAIGDEYSINRENPTDHSQWVDA
jgi:hypothetical protein